MDSKETYGLPVFLKPDPVFGSTDDPIRSSSAKGYRVPPPVITMETYLQNFQPNNNNEPDLSSPPVALSLRTRETSALALKQIFDQHQMINGASSTQRHYHQMGGFQEVRNQSTPYLHKLHSIPDPNGALEKAEEYRMPHAQTGFSSPISASAPPSLQSYQATMIPMNGQLLQHNVVPEAVAASARLNPSSRQSTAQMTIFYSGSVYVYNNVPADRAHAIMVLAGDARTSSYRCPAPPNAAPMPETTVAMREWSPKAAPSQHAANSITMAPSVPVMASLASPPPSPAPSQTLGSLSESMKSSQAGAEAKRQQHGGIELPHARKASLARFLEKRKDRVQVQQQDPQEAVAAAAAGGGSLLSCDDDKPDPAAASFSGKRQCIEAVAAASHAPSILSRSNSNAAAVNDWNEKRTDQEPVERRRFLHRHSPTDATP